mmetsp:Transcript_4414/g.8979  ORF Transcript_4414/g.8979 Transcript_4414/m.8979 type:complete len:123 (-) Transcript_4414:2298-2666(-)
MAANKTFLLLRRMAVPSRINPITSHVTFLRAVSSVSYEQDKSLNVLTRTGSKYKLGKHRSNALELIQKVPPIEVEGDMAVCDGGGGALGHPLEYIKVGNRGGEPVSCIYCGLRFKQKGGEHH